MEKMLVTSIFSFSLNVSKAFFLRAIESQDCVVKISTVYQTTNFWLGSNSKHLQTNQIFLKMLFSVSDKVENIVGKGENAAYKYFLLYQQYFQKAST